MILNLSPLFPVRTDRPKLNDDDIDTGGPEIQVSQYQQEAISLGQLPADPWLIKEMERAVKELKDEANNSNNNNNSNADANKDEIDARTEELDRLKRVALDAPSREDIPIPPTYVRCTN